MTCSFMDRGTSFDPATADTFSSAQICSAIFEGLVAIDEKTSRPKPALARKWMTSDYKTWTFYLKKGVKFHDGSDFTSSSVKFNFDRQLDPSHPFAKPSYGSFDVYKGLFGRYGDFITRVDIPEKYKVRIVLKYPDSDFLRKLAIPAAFMVSPYAVKKFGDELASNPVGTGPYEFSEWRQSAGRFIASRNVGYRELVFPDRIIFEYCEQADYGLRQLARGNTDILFNIASADIKVPNIDKKYEFVKSQPGIFCFLLLNPYKKEFSSPAARRAVSYLIDREDLVSSFGAEEAFSFLAPYHAGYEERGYSFLMSDITYLLSRIAPNRSFVIIYPEEHAVYAINPELVAEKIKNYLRAGGIKSELRKLPLDEYKRALNARNYDLALWGEFDFSGNSDIFLSLLRPVRIFRNFSEAYSWIDEFDEAIKNSRRLAKPKAKASYYAKANEILLKNMPAVPLFYKDQIIIYSERVCNFLSSPYGIVNFGALWLGS